MVLMHQELRFVSFNASPSSGHPNTPTRVFCLYFFSLSVYRSRWRMYVVLFIDQSNVMAFVLLSTWYNVTACVAVL